MAKKLGKSQGLVRFFKIHGLHGYKDLSINFSGEATVVVAENGAGKTTLLSMLSSLLKREFYKLGSFDFISVECLFEGDEKPVIIRKEDLNIKWGDKESSTLDELSKASGVSVDKIVDYIFNSFDPTDPFSIQDHPVGSQMYVSTPYMHEALHEKILSVYEEVLGNLDEQKVAEAFSIIKGKVGDAEVVYLPTYRRIERPLKKKPGAAFGSARNSGRRYGYRKVKRTSEYDDIAFGLSDVEEQLGALAKEIEKRSNLEYRNLSARMLEELLNRDRARSFGGNDLPDIDSLTRFLNRVQRRGIDQVFKKIESLYSTGEIENEENKFARFFLTRLGDVISQTKGIEEQIETFVNVCNSYLELSSDQKKLEFDPDELRVKVTDAWGVNEETEIDLDDLSSGEKQIISLMSHLYLSNGRKILLIDEPELSLSLGWQRKVLPDVMRSGSVSQLLAITHSPFVFENELDDHACSIKIERTMGGIA
ncbi:ATP-binding protein [Chromohalobacter japonicus]|uniref:ATP-binding protein n=1 Tax=Chromohalobacter japonicus TaxID=223900 RepID=UPI001FF586AE|nr:AAA family ATPase [Chromohalobacter japonicus]MCK0754420.1 AAA family ATPase [Chromohalobacter japonicus]